MKFDKYKCRNCHNVIQSKYEGNFVQCPCGDSFVDQTKYYIRVGGPAELYVNTIEEDLDEAHAEQDLKEKTELFWYLQMQFLDTQEFVISQIMRRMLSSNQYIEHYYYTSIIKRLLNRENPTQEEFECICTHLALQLSGADIYE